MSARIRNHKVIQKKSRSHQVIQVGVYTYQVTSGHSGQTYTVRLQDEVRDGAVTYTGAVCGCRWGQFRPSRDWRSGCSHVQAVFNYVDAQRSVSAWPTMLDAKRQRHPVSVIGDGVILTSRKRQRLASAVALWDDGEGI